MRPPLALGVALAIAQSALAHRSPVVSCAIGIGGTSVVADVVAGTLPIVGRGCRPGAIHGDAVVDGAALPADPIVVAGWLLDAGIVVRAGGFPGNALGSTGQPHADSQPIAGVRRDGRVLIAGGSAGYYAGRTATAELYR